jgi:hypothetical protein
VLKVAMKRRVPIPGGSNVFHRIQEGLYSKSFERLGDYKWSSIPTFLTIALCGYKYQVRELVLNRPGALVGQLPELVTTSSEEYWNW